MTAFDFAVSDCVVVTSRWSEELWWGEACLLQDFNSNHFMCEVWMRWSLVASRFPIPLTSCERFKWGEAWLLRDFQFQSLHVRGLNEVKLGCFEISNSTAACCFIATKICLELIKFQTKNCKSEEGEQSLEMSWRKFGLFKVNVLTINKRDL